MTHPTTPTAGHDPSATARAAADRAAALWLNDHQLQLLQVIAAGDHAALGAHLRARGRWWRTLRVLERNHLITVAVVGPHAQPWPWIRADITPTGNTYLNRHTDFQPADHQENPCRT